MKLLDIPDMGRSWSLEDLIPLEGDVGFLVVDPNGGPMEVITDVLNSLLSRFEWLGV